MLLLVLYVSGAKRCEPCTRQDCGDVYLLVLYVSGVNGVSPALVRIVEMCIYWFCMLQV